MKFFVAMGLVVAACSEPGSGASLIQARPDGDMLDAGADAKVEVDAVAEADVEVQAEVVADADAEVDAEAEADAGAEVDADADAEADAVAEVVAETDAGADAVADADAEVDAEAEAEIEVDAPCVPDCTGNACGDDGCGGICPAPDPTCGDGTCDIDAGERCGSPTPPTDDAANGITRCLEDCGICILQKCGDTECATEPDVNGLVEKDLATGENSCTLDCGKIKDSGCGNASCVGGETCISCPTDCGSCVPPGDGMCSEYESCDDPQSDCGPCPLTCD